MLPETKQAISEVSIDGGIVRLRGSKGEKSYWRDYKAVREHNASITAVFSVTTNRQQIRLIVSGLSTRLTCLGDGHDGVWNLFKEIGTVTQRQEILDWYHLKKNLYKVGGSLKRLKQAERLLWKGLVDDLAPYLFIAVANKLRIFAPTLTSIIIGSVNYEYFQAEQLCSIGSGAVESAVKQIDRRIKISGALREIRERSTDAPPPHLLSQWSTRYLIFLQN